MKQCSHNLDSDSSFKTQRQRKKTNTNQPTKSNPLLLGCYTDQGICHTQYYTVHSLSILVT